MPPSQGVWKGRTRAAAWALALLALWAILQALPQGPAWAATGIRLIMVQEPSCRFCRKWEADIGPAYPKSAEGRFAPLVRVRRNAAAIRGFAPVVYTPTFILFAMAKRSAV